jgi:hypothetical protein
MEKQEEKVVWKLWEKIIIYVVGFFVLLSFTTILFGGVYGQYRSMSDGYFQFFAAAILAVLSTVLSLILIKRLKFRFILVFLLIVIFPVIGFICSEPYAKFVVKSRLDRVQKTYPLSETLKVEKIETANPVFATKPGEMLAYRNTAYYYFNEKGVFSPTTKEMSDLLLNNWDWKLTADQKYLYYHDYKLDQLEYLGGEYFGQIGGVDIYEANGSAHYRISPRNGSRSLSDIFVLPDNKYLIELYNDRSKDYALVSLDDLSVEYYSEKEAASIIATAIKPFQFRKEANLNEIGIRSTACGSYYWGEDSQVAFGYVTYPETKNICAISKSDKIEKVIFPGNQESWTYGNIIDIFPGFAPEEAIVLTTENMFFVNKNKPGEMTKVDLVDTECISCMKIDAIFNK